MKTRIWLLGLAAALSLAGIMGVTILLMGRPALATPTTDGYRIYYVAPGGDCGGMTPCFSTIQAAVDAVDADGETVKVAQGVYTSNVYAVVQITRALSLEGGFTTTNWTTAYPMTQLTVLYGEEERGVLSINPHSIATRIVVKGFHITGGYRRNDSYPYPLSLSAGVFIGDDGETTLSDNYIFDNHADGIWGNGGGVIVTAGALPSSGRVVLVNNRIENNSATYAGGGLYICDSSPILISNTIAYNDCLGNCWGEACT